MTPKKLLVGTAVLGAFFIASIVVADVIPGLSTTNVSNDVTLTQLTLNKPGDAQVGDVLVANVAVNGGSPAVITAPPDWKLILRTDNDTNVGIASYYKIVAISETSSYTWNITPQARAAGGITRYSGVDMSNPIDVSGGATGRGVTAIAPSVTTTADNTHVIALFAINVGTNNSPLFSSPTGMEKNYDVKNTPFGPTSASLGEQGGVAGPTGIRSSTVSNGPQRDWAAQLIALRMLPTPVTAETFEGYASGSALTGQNGGTDWLAAWTGSSAFVVDTTAAIEGVKAARVNLPGGQEASVSRNFEPKSAGILHWAQRKDAPDHGSVLQLLSGNTIATNVSIGSVTQPQAGGPDWNLQDGPSNVVILQDYIVGSFDTVDLEFDTVTDQYRVSINSGPYSQWYNFLSPVSDINTVRFGIQASGNDVGNNYWDDIRLTP